LTGFVTWYAQSSVRDVSSHILHGNATGGKLSQTPAKAIDLVSGAVFAPLVTAAFSYYWFRPARVTAVNEKRPSSSVSLAALALASNTNTGSYDFIKLWVFVQSKRARLLLFGTLMILAAVANTALANVIAYEAYSLDDLRDTSTLCLLRAEDVYGGQSMSSSPYNFTRD